MSEADIIVKLEIIADRCPKAESVADAINAWAKVMHAAASVIEPGVAVRIELVGVESGSQMFKLAIRRIDEVGQRLKDGADEFPLLKKLAITLAGLGATTVMSVVITNAITPDPRIPPDQMAVFNEMNQTLKESLVVQQKTMQFYEILANEPAFERFEVLRGSDRGLVCSVPRGDFALRSGLGQEVAQAANTVETRTTTMEVTLIKPTLIAEPRGWTFAREGLEFSALMDDPLFLDAIHNKTLPIQIAEGISMEIEIQYREKFDGKAWRPILGSRKVKRVLSRQPPPPMSGFVSPSGEP